MRIEIPGIDEKNALDFYDGDLNIYLSVLRSYLAHVPVAIEKLRNVSNETLHDYMITIHGVKSTSASICAEEISKTGAKLEAMAKAGDIAGVLALNQGFLKQVEDLVERIRSWLKQTETNR